MGGHGHKFRETDMKYGMAKWIVVIVLMPQTDATVTTPLPTTFAVLIQSLHIIPGQSQMPQRTS